MSIVFAIFIFLIVYSCVNREKVGTSEGLPVVILILGLLLFLCYRKGMGA